MIVALLPSWLFPNLLINDYYTHKNVLAGGCESAATISVAVGSGKNPEKGSKVLDSNLRTKWVSFGKGESLWLELEPPGETAQTVVDSVAIAFRKVKSWAIVTINK